MLALLALSLAAAAPEPAPQPRVPALCGMPIIIYFDNGSSALSDHGRAVLDIGSLAPRNAFALATRVRIEAHSDTVGSRARNLSLSRRRAMTVRDYLVRSGVAPNLIDIEPRGESHPMVPTPDEISEPSNRYVQVFEQLSQENLAARKAAQEEGVVC